MFAEERTQVFMVCHEVLWTKLSSRLFVLILAESLQVMNC